MPPAIQPLPSGVARGQPRIWPDIAKDIVLATIDRSLTGRFSYGDVAARYGLSADDLRFLAASPAFQGLVRAERRRADELGDRAAFTFKAEEMVRSLAENLYGRLMSDEAPPPLGELRLGFETLSRAAGLDQPAGGGKGREGAGGASGVNIQINIPELPNGKLGHLRVAADGS
ncbi:MAG: hypothetical protein LBL95_00015 [Deltaproteobacteria bacterium]|jgi:hypothetical protein|nr:hypothetical protein [Deltaproteobacteria bacterium]